MVRVLPTVAGYLLVPSIVGVAPSMVHELLWQLGLCRVIERPREPPFSNGQDWSPNAAEPEPGGDQ